MSEEATMQPIIPIKPLLLREVLGEQLREERTVQGKTLRQVSSEARVSLGYLSEVERGQKEASSELLASICSSLDLPLSDLLMSVGDRVARSETMASAPRGLHPVAALGPVTTAAA